MIVIPIFKPNSNLINLVKNLKKFSKSGYNENILIINDGSFDDKSKFFFDILKKKKFIKIINHKKNMGKGAAIKTALKYGIKNKINFLVFADGDGQHHHLDIIKFIKKSKKKSRFFIGKRNFNNKVPYLNKLGNKLSSILFLILFRVNVDDTQNGLRSIPQKFYKICGKSKSNGFGYETEIIIKMIKKYRTEIVFVPIKTIYDNYKKGFATHFKPFSDSIKILYHIILNFLKN